MSSSSSNFTVSTVGRTGSTKSKSRTKEPEAGDKKFYLVNIAQCLLAVVIAFAVYGIVICFVGKNSGKYDNFEPNLATFSPCRLTE